MGPVLPYLVNISEDDMAIMECIFLIHFCNHSSIDYLQHLSQE